jgi:beta-1,2-mannobiose phosphorylase / 1,2-beta-oligomannan phosphorylase
MKFIKILISLLLLVLLPEFIQSQTQWTKDPANPAPLNGSSGSWNYNVWNPFVIYNEDSSRYEMWFGGDNGISPYIYRIGFAISYDGSHWTMPNNSPVLTPTPGAWDSSAVFSPMVIREDGEYKMWYAGGKNDFHNRIGYATSPDGVNWTKYSANPILIPDAPWETDAVGNHCVVHSLNGYQMWYLGGINDAVTTGAIGYATSIDGISWIKDTVHNPVLTKGAAGEWDGRLVWAPRVLNLNGMYYMWYSGMSQTNYRRIGLATSADSGITWNKYSNNPVLTPTSSIWDALYVQDGQVIFYNDTLHMWYTGVRGSSFKIGHATSTITIGGADDFETAILGSTKLFQNYPNPFNPRTDIRFTIQDSRFTSLKVYNVLGREVATLVNEVKQPGEYTATWDAANAPSGMYFYRLTAGSYTETKKLILMK